MKIISVFTSLLFLVLIGCGETHSNNENQNNETEKLSQNIPANSNTDSGECCMESEGDFEPFLPASAGSFTTKRGFSANMFCLNDPDMHSQALRSYFDADGNKFRVMMRDYCSKDLEDFAHMADPNKDKTVKEEPGEFKILEMDGVYQGFAKHYKQDPGITNGNPAYVKVIVDDRFYLQVQALEQTGVGQVLALFESLPVADLADFGK